MTPEIALLSCGACGYDAVRADASERTLEVQARVDRELRSRWVEW